MSQIPSYVSDTVDFNKQLLNGSSILPTADVESIYTSRPHNEGIEIISWSSVKYRKDTSPRQQWALYVHGHNMDMSILIDEINIGGSLKLTLEHGDNVQFLNIGTVRNTGISTCGNCNPSSTKRAMIYGGTLRSQRICSGDVAFEKSIMYLTSSFAERGYSRKQIYLQVNRVGKLDRNATLTKMKKNYYEIDAIVDYH
ncbi:hypothetical protein GJ496_005765 [Pomphorhynchus laevis]|nr:hypothetical protein GJ496_005765 [Pomphorhynchus laevis]